MSLKVGEEEILKNVLRLESSSLGQAAEKIQQEAAQKLGKIFEELIAQEGSLCFCGVGKSGYIARKLVATFSSLGLSSYFLHPTEALHGDLGLLKSRDAVVFISKSGTTEEIIKLLPFLPIPKERRIGLLGEPGSLLAQEVSVFFDCSVEREACLNNQAPTTSSTLALAMGDAMAVLFESIAGVNNEKFAVNHPGGLLGKSLRLKVGDLMCSREQSPTLRVGQSLKEALLEMTRQPVGGCALLNEKNELLGILVEGDIRRYFASSGSTLEEPIENLINKNPVIISSSQKALEALKLMEGKERSISLLPVVDGGEFRGFIRLHDLLQEGFSSS